MLYRTVAVSLSRREEPLEDLLIERIDGC